MCLNYVMRHPVAFRNYFIPRLWRRRFWHRYTFMPAVFAIDRGDTSVAAGRATGKSAALLEPTIPQRAILRQGEETLLTTFRRLHTMDRMERVIDYFEQIPLFRLYLSRVLRSPQYTVQLRNGHMVYGISVGDDPEARMVVGKHASTVIIDESQIYPARAFLKLEGAKDPRGSTMLMVGVPDGRLDTPFRAADEKYSSFEGRRFHLTRRADPFWDQPTKQRWVDSYGGENTDLFKQEIDSDWGNPVWSAWDIESIQRCMEDQFLGDPFPPVVLEISGRVYRERRLTPDLACADLPGPTQSLPTIVAMDVGYSQPSEVGVFQMWHDRWWLAARIQLTTRMEHDDQAKVVNEIARLYKADRVGLDCTEGEGRAIAAELDKMGWEGRIARYVATENQVIGWTPEGAEIYDISRSVATTTLRAMWGHREIAIPKDDYIPTEFNREMEARSPDGKTRVITPATCHCPDMMRVFALMRFQANPPLPPNTESAVPFVMPEFSDEPSPWHSTAAAMLF